MTFETKKASHWFIRRYRIKGNDFFKTSEYDDAIAEYSKSINIFPTAAAYNNRAMTCELPNRNDSGRRTHSSSSFQI